MNYQSIAQNVLNKTNPESSNLKEYKKIKIKILMVNQQELLGTVIIPGQGYKSRLSDLINNSQNFLALTDVEVYEENILMTKTPFLCINKQSIIYLAEDEKEDFSSASFLEVKIDECQ